MEDKKTSRPMTLPRIDKDILPSKQKRAKKMSPRTMLGRINQYFEHCERTDAVPSISGMMIHMKIYERAFYNYIKDDNYRDMLEHARLIIKNWAEEDVYKTRGLAAGKVAYMKSIHGWADRVETSTTNVSIDLTPDVARAKLESLAPKLLELLKNQNVLDQLAHRPIEIESKEIKDA